MGGGVVALAGMSMLAVVLAGCGSLDASPTPAPESPTNGDEPPGAPFPAPDEEPRGTAAGACLDPTLGSGTLLESDLPEGAVVVSAGESIHEAAQRAGTGATIVIASGTHLGQSVEPMDGQTFIGVPGAVLEGDGAPFAFRSTAVEVTIRGLVIRGYEPPSKEAAVHVPDQGGWWVVENNEIAHNAEVGLRMARFTVARDNYVHHNGRYGITGSGQDLVVEGNEIACNAIDYGATGDSSGTKFVYTTDLVLKDNLAHHNLGNGLWIDIDNRNARVEQNRLLANDRSGIFVEISCGALVTGNTLEGNGFGARRPDNSEHGAIYVANSPDVEVTGNRLSGNLKGITAMHWRHPDVGLVERCTPALQNLLVRGNTIEQDGGILAGIDATVDRGDVWSGWNNRFQDNTYLSGSGTFRWRDRLLTPEQWTVEAGQS